MGGSKIRLSRVAARCLSVVVLAVAALGCQSSESYSQPGTGARGSGDCYGLVDLTGRDPLSEAARCSAIAADPKARRNNAQLANAHFNAGRAYAAAGDFRSAKNSMTSALLVSPGRDDVRLSLAQVLRAGADPSRQPVAATRNASYAEAMDLLQTVIDNEPRQRPSLASQAKYERALVYLARGGEGDQEIALRDLKAALPLPEARARMEREANELGMRAFTAAPSPENTQRAIDMFTDAGAANPSAPGPYLMLGRAEMRMAGLYGSRGVADYGCTPGYGNQAALERALGHFETATRNAPSSPEGYAGSACALQAMGGRNAEATRKLEQAVAAAQGPQQTTYKMLLAKSLMMEGRSGEAIAGFRAVLSQVSTDADRAMVLVELAQAYSLNANDPNSARNAMQAAQEAIEINKRIGAKDRSAAPYLIAGRFHQSKVDDQLRAAAGRADEAERSAPSDPSKALDRAYYRELAAIVASADYKAAVNYFTLAVETADRSESRDVRRLADALYELSWLEDLKATPVQRVSIGSADRAVGLMAGQWNYRSQACLARIRVGEVISESARAYCTTAEDRTNPDALALEGLYFLRRAHAQRYQEARRDAWERAYRSFDDGLRTLGQAQGPEISLLRARMLVGRGLAHFCIGFENVGERAIYGDERESDGGARTLARAWYAQYGAFRCYAETRRS